MHENIWGKNFISCIKISFSSLKNFISSMKIFIFIPENFMLMIFSFLKLFVRND